MNNRDKLIDIISQYKLERREVAELLHVPLETVFRWLLPLEGSGREDIPDMAVELLRLKLEPRTPQPAAADQGGSG